MIEAFLLLATAIYLLSLSSDFFSLKISQINLGNNSGIDSGIDTHANFQANMLSKQCLKNQKVIVRY